MKKIRISLVLAMISVVSLFGSAALAAGGGLANDSVLSQHIKEADGTTGQNTNTGSGVKTAHIQDGAVTPAKIGFYNNVIVVAPSGGDFTSPVDALNAITDASATNPYLVKIMPGVYNIGSSTVQMKPYVDIEGSGENVTKIKGNIDTQLSGVVRGASNAEIRSLTVENTGGGSSAVGIYNSSASPRILHLTVAVSGAADWNFGILNNSSSPEITEVTVTSSGGTYTFGIYNNQSSSPVITDVTITASGGWYSNYGVSNGHLSSPVMTNVNVSASGGIGSHYGIINDAGSGGIVTIHRSTIKGPIGNLSGGFTLNIGVSQVTEGITSIGGVVNCFQVYNGTFAPVTCP